MSFNWKKIKLSCHLNLMFENKLWHRSNTSFMSCVCIWFLLKMRQKWNCDCSSSLSEQYTYDQMFTSAAATWVRGQNKCELCELWCSISVHVSRNCTTAVWLAARFGIKCLNSTFQDKAMCSEKHCMSCQNYVNLVSMVWPVFILTFGKNDQI